MNQWLAAGVTAAALGYAATHSGNTSQPPPAPPASSSDSSDLDKVLTGFPRMAPGESDGDWCRAMDQYYVANGVEIPDDSMCQGHTSKYWKDQKPWQS